MLMIDSERAHELLRQLSDHYGLVSSYHDVFGNLHQISHESAIRVLQSMRVLPKNEDITEGTLEAAWNKTEDMSWSQFVAPVQVFRESQQPLWARLNVPTQIDLNKIRINLIKENGEQVDLGSPNKAVEVGHKTLSHGTQFTAWNWEIPIRLTPGYHRLVFSIFGSETQQLLVCAPETAYEPLSIQQGKRCFGPALQLYSLRSEKNWGIGDFGDLQNTIRLLGPKGVDAVGVNPLHALFPHQPNERSPYSPSSRLFFNAIYLDIPSLPEWQEAPEVQAWFNSPDVQAQLAEARDGDLVNYQIVGHLKQEALRRLFRVFEAKHLVDRTERANAFEQFILRHGHSLQRLALYQTLQETLTRQNPEEWGWPVWGDAWKDPNSETVLNFTKEHKADLLFYMWQQFLISEQLQETNRVAKESGMDIGLYLDLAVGSGVGGADVWANQNLYVTDVNVGCPPDAFSLLGQNWGLPALHPQELRNQAFRPFIQMVRQNMRYAGALRIDHFVAMHRIFWIPEGMGAKDGVYVLHDMDALMGILALESHRNQCLVIGEDLGTVPPIIEEKMREWGIYSYKVFFFEKENNETLKHPQDYLDRAVVTLSTHDLPTLYGFWAGSDIGVRDDLNLFPNTELRERFIQEREIDRFAILKSLKNEGLLPPEFSDNQYDNFPEPPESLAIAAHRFMARTPCKLQLFQFEDLLKFTQQMNFPGTVYEHPNWQRKLPVTLEALIQSEQDGTHPLFWHCLQAMREERA